MCTRRFGVKGPLGAIAALGIAAALAGPALAGGGGPSGRTGHINQDCDGFSLQRDGNRFLLRANCRVSDDNNDKKATSIDLADNIGNWGGDLTWNNRFFHLSCGHISLEDVTLKAYCPYSVCPRRGGECSTRRKWSWMNLHSHYKVNSSGDLAIK